MSIRKMRARETEFLDWFKGRKQQNIEIVFVEIRIDIFYE